MSLLNNEIKLKIKEHALAKSPNECCGIIIKKNKNIDVVKCKNIAYNKRKLFEISAQDYLKASKMGSVEGYYHSHTEDNFNLSGADKAVRTSHKIPLIMYSITENKFIEY